MFTQTEIDYIERVKNASDIVKYSKATLNKLKAIKTRITNVKFTNCFCSAVVRRVYFKDFIDWYEATT